MKALIIEPSKLFQMVLKTLFLDSSFEIAIATTFEEAKALISKEKFDLITVALALRDISGIEFALWARDDELIQKLPIFMITAEVDDVTINKALKSGVTEVLQKSDISHLSQMLKALKKRSEQSKKLNGSVLYVEDSRSIADLTTQILEQAGLEVDHYISAEDALQALEQNSYDLILTDVILEGTMTGLGLVRYVRDSLRHSNLPILAVSGMNDLTRRIELLKSGANDYISKPIVEEELLARVSSLISSKQLLDEVESQKEYLQKLAMTDQLTSLYNRHCLAELAPKYLSTAIRHKHPLSILVVDLDHFKAINDNHGHAVGDIVLAELGKLLNVECRKGDMAVRFGGEEFVLLLDHCCINSAMSKANSLRKKIEALQPGGLTVTSSIGISTLPTDAEIEFDDLFQAADQAVYLAKEKGRNQVVGKMSVDCPNPCNDPFCKGEIGEIIQYPVDQTQSNAFH